MTKDNVCRYCRRFAAGRFAMLLVLMALMGTLCACRLNEKKDEADGQVRITPEFTKKVSVYQQLTPFSEGLSAVCVNGKWGYINMAGDCVIPCRYDNAAPFVGGVAQVKSGRSLRYIDVRGKEVPGGVRKKGLSKDGRYHVFSEGRSGGKCGIADSVGNIVVQAMYDSLTYVSDGLSVAVLYRKTLCGADIDAELQMSLPTLTEDNLDNPVVFMTDSAIQANTVCERIYGFVDLFGNHTFPDGIIEEIERNDWRFKRYVERQASLERIENNRIEWINALRQQALVDSLDAVLNSCVLTE